MLNLVMAPLNVNYKIFRIKSLGDSNVTESQPGESWFCQRCSYKSC